MRIPSERETRQVFAQFGYYLAPIDRARGDEAVCLHIGSAKSKYVYGAPTLKRLWEEWAELAVEYRIEEECVDAVVERWRTGSRRVRSSIEHWIDAFGDAPWEKQCLALLKTVPSYGMSSRRMPRGWRTQLIKDMLSKRKDQGAYIYERVGRRIRKKTRV